MEQCICNRLQAQEILHEWVAYSATKQGVKLTMDTLEQFEHEVAGPQILICITNYLLNMQQLSHSLLLINAAMFVILQVLNKKIKSRKTSRKEEASSRMRDISMIDDLYPSH